MTTTPEPDAALTPEQQEEKAFDEAIFNLTKALSEVCHDLPMPVVIGALTGLLTHAVVVGSHDQRGLVEFHGMFARELQRHWAAHHPGLGLLDDNGHRVREH